MYLLPPSLSTVEQPVTMYPIKLATKMIDLFIYTHTLRIYIIGLTDQTGRKDALKNIHMKSTKDTFSSKCKLQIFNSIKPSAHSR